VRLAALRLTSGGSFLQRWTLSNGVRPDCPRCGSVKSVWTGSHSPGISNGTWKSSRPNSTVIKSAKVYTMQNYLRPLESSPFPSTLSFVHRLWAPFHLIPPKFTPVRGHQEQPSRWTDGTQQTLVNPKHLTGGQGAAGSNPASPTGCAVYLGGFPPKFPPKLIEHGGSRSFFAPVVQPTCNP
jgi:hypothetical protein